MKAANKVTPPSFPCDCCFALVPVILASFQSQQASAFPDIQEKFHTRTRRRAAAHQHALVSSQFSHGRIEGSQVHPIYLHFHQRQEIVSWKLYVYNVGKKKFFVFVFSFFTKLTFFFFFRKSPLQLLAIIFNVKFSLFPTKFRWNCV